MPRKLLGMTALLCLLAFQAQAADDKKPDDKSDKDKLQGTWVVTAFEIMGKTIDAPKDQESTLTFKDDKLTMKDDKKTEEGSYKLDEKKNPKEIDLTAPKKDNAKEMETLKAIYKFDSETLKIAMPANGAAGARPTGFDGKDVGVMVLKKKK